MKLKKGSLRQFSIYLWYSLLFLFIFTAAFYPFFRNGKSLMWTQDAVRINYPAFHYLGTRIRDIIINFLNSGSLQIPLYDFSIGYGQDIIQYMGTFYLDPLNLLGVLVKAEYMEYMYEALIVFRIWISGVFFSLLGRYKQYDDFGVLCGALIYAFSGYTFYMVLFLPCFGTMMFLLPLLIYGVEKILNKDSFWPFVLTVAYNAASSWYCLYINSIICLIYACIWLKVHKVSGKETLKIFAKAAVLYTCGGALASVILIPGAIAYFDSARHSATILTPSLLNYERGRIIKCLVDMFAPYTSPGYTTYINMSAWGVFCIIDLWSNNTQDSKIIRWLFGFLFVGLFIPFFGFAIGGFNYVNNRWSFAFVFAAALAAAGQSSLLLKADMERKIRLLGYILLLGLVILVCESVQNLYTFAGFIFLLLFMCVVLYCGPCQREWKTKYTMRIIKLGLLAVISLNCIILGRFTFSENYGKYTNEFIDCGETYSSIMKGYRKDAAEIKDTSFYRIDFNRTGAVSASMIGKYSGILDVFNELPESMVDHAREQLLYSMGTNSYYGLDSRAILDALASVKYFVQDKTYSDKVVPWGYQLYKETKDSSIYKNTYALPLGYAYTKQIERAAYASMKEADRQYAFLNAVVLDEADAELFGLQKWEPLRYAEELPYSVEKDGVGHENGSDQYVINKNNASLTLSFSVKRDSETLLLLDNINVDSIASTVSESLFIPVMTALGTYKHNIRSNRNWFRIGDDRKYLLNLGPLEAGEQTCKITFPPMGDISIEDIKIYNCPMEPLAESVRNFMSIPLENIEVGVNRITADIRSDERIALCLAIPYSRGWTAYVDGKETELSRVNTMYMGFPLEAGEHSIELRYFTPGLMMGIVLSSGMLILLIMFIVYERIWKKSDER